MRVKIIIVLFLIIILLFISSCKETELTKEQILINERREFLQLILTENIYSNSLELFKDREYERAKALFENIGDYKDSRDYVTTIIYIQASGIMRDNPDAAVEMFLPIKDYDENISEFVHDILYIIASNHMNNGRYEKALPVFENILNYKDSGELFELCGRHIKYINAVAEFNGLGEPAYTAFAELGDFLESMSYINYINAGKYAEEENFSEAAAIYLSLGDFLDSRDLYKKYAYIYYVEMMGAGVYIDSDSGRFGGEVLAELIYPDIPGHLLSDSAENARYIINFTGTSRYYGTYNDGSDAYQTTVTVIVTDIVEQEILFSQSFTAYPPTEGYLPEGDVYAVFDFLEIIPENGLSVYESDIRPVLTELFKFI
ncbi:MAG: hypothetical protein FWH10_02145 [Oscillospiraceae bacterium]|nr:hypothetical protein [Oscillospiraceae bacterium]